MEQEESTAIVDKLIVPRGSKPAPDDPAVLRMVAVIRENFELSDRDVLKLVLEGAWQQLFNNTPEADPVAPPVIGQEAG